MAFITKIRILFHVARKNSSIIWGNGVQIISLVLGTLLFGGAGAAKLTATFLRGDLINAAFLLVAVLLGIFCLMGLILAIGQVRSACRKVLTPSIRPDLLAVPYGEFETHLSKVDRPLTLFKI